MINSSPSKTVTPSNLDADSETVEAASDISSLDQRYIHIKLLLVTYLCSFSSSAADAANRSSASPPSDESDQPPHKRRKCNKDDVDAAVLLHVKNQVEERKKRQQDATEDDFFGSHVACVMKRLNNRVS